MRRRSLVDHRGRTIDFGRAATDYARYRPGFPDSMFDRLSASGWIAPDLRALDLGTGSGNLALGLAARGLETVGLDVSRELLDVARDRAAALGLDVRFPEGRAEDTGLEADAFDLVTAGQCWWWFDAEKVLAEVRRLLRPGGRLLMANFAYLATPGSVAEATERLILAHNPGWPKAGGCGVFPAQVEDLDTGGFARVESFSYVEPVRFSHEAWRGRIRSCNGVGASLEAGAVKALDRDLASLLSQRAPGQELVIPHRVFVATGVIGRAA